MKEGIPLTAQAVGEMYDAIGALVLAITYELPEPSKASMQAQLQRLAESKNAAGHPVAAACLLDFARAVEFARKHPRG